MQDDQNLLQGTPNDDSTADIQFALLYRQIKDNIHLLEKNEINAQATKEQRYLRAYLTLFEQMSAEVAAARLRYRQIDKEKLIDDKCLKLAENVKLFREEATDIDQELKRTEFALAEIQAKNTFLQSQIECLKVGNEKKLTTSLKQKQFFKSTFGEIKGKEPIHWATEVKSSKRQGSKEGSFTGWKEEEFDQVFPKTAPKARGMSSRLRAHHDKRQIGFPQSSFQKDKEEI